MKHEIIFSPQAVEDLKHLAARDRSVIPNAIETYLRFEPQKISRSHIQRLRSFRNPQFRLRIEDYRVFYDVTDGEVGILAIISKSEASDWLDQAGGLE